MHNGGLERLSYLTIITELYTTPWIFIGSTDTEAEAPILWPLNANSQHFGKDPDAGKDWKQKEKRVAKDWMVGWHQWFNGHELRWTPGDSEGLEGLAAVHGVTESDTTWWLNNYNIPVSVHWHRSTKFIKVDIWAEALAHLKWKCLTSTFPNYPALMHVTSITSTS